jgi:hypothetical protein
MHRQEFRAFFEPRLFYEAFALEFALLARSLDLIVAKVCSDSGGEVDELRWAADGELGEEGYVLCWVGGDGFVRALGTCEDGGVCSVKYTVDNVVF